MKKDENVCAANFHSDEILLKINYTNLKLLYTYMYVTQVTAEVDIISELVRR
jgi:hypothetical protein